MSNEPVLPGKVRQLIADATALLDPVDRAERIRYCIEHDEHGVRMRQDGGLFVFTWGGRPLAGVEAEAIVDDDVDLALVEPPPDTIPAEWRP